MSFSQSTGTPISTDNINSVVLFGTNGIASSGGGNNGLYYTSNSGQGWTQSDISTGNFSSVVLSGTNGIAASASGDGLYYSTNSGVNWIQSTLTTGSSTSGSFSTISLSGTNAIAASSSDDIGIFYSSNSGQTWTQSSNRTTGVFQSVSLSGTNGIAGGDAAGVADGIWYSTNSGVTWTKATLTTGGPTNSSFASVFLDGSNGIAGSFADDGILYSTTSGATWSRSILTSTGTFTDKDWYSVFLSGTRGVAGSGTTNRGIYYSTNSGQTWTPSSQTTGDFKVALSGAIGIAGAYNYTGLSTVTGIYRSTNYGQNWAPTNITTGNYNSVALYNNTAILGSSTNEGVYYSLNTLCYEKNTLILVLENEIEVYKKICELKVGDIVKTYKHGYKKITMIKSFNYNTTNITRLKRCMYRMIGHDIIVTGKHGILVDEVTEEEIIRTKKCGTTIRQIDDKQVLPACASDKFEKITDHFEFELWHFVLENDDESKNYGIYITDGILSESCSEKAFSNE